MPFNRILLKFGIIRETFRKIHRAFGAYDRDGNGTIEYGELVHAMRDLGATEMSDDDIEQVFHEADVYHSERLNFKSFLICIALGYLLGDVPIAPADGPKPERDVGSSESLELSGAIVVSSGSELAVEPETGADAGPHDGDAGTAAGVGAGAGDGATSDAGVATLPPVLQGTAAL